MAKGMDLYALDRGVLRHPLFGNRNHWYSQKVKRSWWTYSLNKAADSGVVRRELLRGLDEIAKKL